MGITIEGINYTGRILTFGTGKDYPVSMAGFNQAVADHGSEHLLCLCYDAGELYILSGFFELEDDYNRYFKAMVPGCVIPQSLLYRNAGAYTGIIMFEGFQIGRSVGYYGSQCDIRSATCKTVFSKCVCYGPSYYPAFLNINVAGGQLAAYNCILYNSLIRYQLGGDSVNVRIHRCQTVNTSYGTAAGGLENDYVLTPTIGYGAGYGDDLIVLSEGTLLNRYWVGNSGNWNNPSHWSYTSGGVSGVSVPTENENVIIDENSFNTEGQYIDFSPYTVPT